MVLLNPVRGRDNIVHLRATCLQTNRQIHTHTPCRQNAGRADKRALHCKHRTGQRHGKEEVPSVEYLREARGKERGKGREREREKIKISTSFHCSLPSASLTHWVPSRHDDSSVVGFGLDGVDNPCQLVHPLTSVVRVHILILGPKVSPLEPIHWTKVT